MKIYIELIRLQFDLPDSNRMEYSEECWQELTDRYGISPPDEYRKFISLLGVGCFNDFLWIYSPEITPVNKYLSVYGPNELFLEYFYEFFDDEFDIQDDCLGFESYEMDLFPWGGTDNADILYWGKVQECYGVIVVKMRDRTAQFFNKSIPEFLYLLVNNSIKCELFPEDAFEEHTPTFTLYLDS